MPKLLVTGGCGFIGSNFIRYILRTEPSVQVLNLDLLTYAGNLENLADLEDDYTFIHGDIADEELVRELMFGVDAVINFAAESHVDRSIHDSSPFVRTNIQGTQVLLDAAREFGVSRFLQVSTDEVYGSLGRHGCFSEQTPLAPNSPYAASKAAADLLVRSCVQTFDFPALITRCSNNYGPYQYPEKLIPLFITKLLRDEPVPVYGDGQQVRDWIHVRDHCAALWQILQRGRVGEVYNIGGRCERTNLEVVHTLLEALNKPRTLIRHVDDRPGHDRRYAIDCGKLERELGWRPAIAFADGIRETVAWYTEHADWVESIQSGAYLTYMEKQYGLG